MQNIEVKFISKGEYNTLSSPITVDVREPNELDDALGHIVGVINIPVGQLSQRLDEIEQYKDKEIITVCRSGARATTAAQILASSGFKNTKVLKGGMSNYRK